MELSKRIVHISTCLSQGGAQIMLYRLVTAMDRSRFQPSVITLSGDGPMGEKLRSAGIPVRFLGLSSSSPNPLLMLRLIRWLRAAQPALVQTWEYHADLIGGIASRAARIRNVVWNIRNSTLDPYTSKQHTRLTVRFLASLSGILPAQIVCNSVKAQDIHIKKGYRADKIVVIPNGFDLNMFRPDPLCRTSVRMELAVPEEAPLIGMVARFDPQKDHLTFIRAAKHLTQRYRKAQFLLCGDGVTWDNRALCEPIEALGLKKYFHLLGQRGDIPRLMASLDVFTLTSSSGESFPNVVGEAMACGVPCVATDIGDSAQIMGDTGKIVRSGDALAIAAGWEELLFLSAAARLRIGKELRRRIEENYSLPDIAKRYESLYATL